MCKLFLLYRLSPALIPREKGWKTWFLQPFRLFCHAWARGSRATSYAAVAWISWVLMSEVIRIKNEHYLSKYFPIYPWKITFCSLRTLRPPANPHFKDSSNISLPNLAVFFPSVRCCAVCISCALNHGNTIYGEEHGRLSACVPRVLQSFCLPQSKLQNADCVADRKHYSVPPPS